MIFAMLYSGIANSAIRSVDEIFEHINSGRKETIICGGIGKQYVEYSMSVINKNNTMTAQIEIVNEDGRIVMPMCREYNLSLIEMATRSNGIMNDEFFKNKHILVGVVTNDKFVTSFYVLKDILRISVKNEQAGFNIAVNLSKYQVENLIECSNLIKTITESY